MCASLGCTYCLQVTQIGTLGLGEMTGRIKFKVSSNLYISLGEASNTASINWPASYCVTEKRRLQAASVLPRTSNYNQLEQISARNNGRPRILLRSECLVTALHAVSLLVLVKVMSRMGPLQPPGKTIPSIRRADGKGRVDLSNLDVAERHLRVGLDLENVGRAALGGIAGSSLALVEPVHEASLVPPETHDEDHAAGHGLAHALHAAEPREGAGACGGAVFFIHKVDLGDPGERDDGALDDPVVLHVVSVQLCERAALVGEELGHDGKLSRAVDLEGAAASIVARVVVAVGIPSAAGLVTNALGTALGTGAFIEAGLVARVRRNVSGSRVCLPNVELIAA